VLDAAYAEYVTTTEYEAGVALATQRDNVVMTAPSRRFMVSPGCGSAGATAPLKLSTR